MTLMTIGYKTIDNFNESRILQNGFSKVSNHIFFNRGILTKSSSLINLYSWFIFIYFLQSPNIKAGHTSEFN